MILSLGDSTFANLPRTLVAQLNGAGHVDRFVVRHGDPPFFSAICTTLPSSLNSLAPQLRTNNRVRVHLEITACIRISNDVFDVGPVATRYLQHVSVDSELCFLQVDAIFHQIVTPSRVPAPDVEPED